VAELGKQESKEGPRVIFLCCRGAAIISKLYDGKIKIKNDHGSRLIGPPGRIPDLRIRSGCSLRSHLQFNVAQKIIRIRLRIRNCMRVITEYDQDQNIKFCPALICRRCCAPSNSSKNSKHKAVFMHREERIRHKIYLVRVNLVWVDGASSLPPQL
jgi:hypothetical protein